MNKDECGMMNDEFGKKSGQSHALVIHHSSFIIHHSPHSPRRGLSLLEVLVSIFILTLGILGVATLIPIGKVAMVETNKSDRTGAMAAPKSAMSRSEECSISSPSGKPGSSIRWAWSYRRRTATSIKHDSRHQRRHAANLAHCHWQHGP